jgi:predicted XRE-type DNA-binding protein
MGDSRRLSTPYADLVPPLSQSEYAILKADIKENGVQIPIVVDELGSILDGHHRYSIDKNAPSVVMSGLSELEKRAYVIKANDARRNLSPEQRAELRKAQQKLCKDLNATGEWTQKQIALILGVGRQTVSDWLKVTSFAGAGKASKNHACDAQVTDCRIKLTREHIDAIESRIDEGDTQSQIASDFAVSQQRIAQIAKRARSRKESDEERAVAVEAIETVAKEDGNIICGDFRGVAHSIPDNSIELIFTDPPYFTDIVPLYKDLAEVASRVLVNGGSLITYCGHALISKILDGIRDVSGIRFYWACACIHTGRSARMPRSGIVVKWKPMLWFIKGAERFDTSVFVDDGVVSEPEKDTHKWQQGAIEASYYIEKLTGTNGTVFDPFCGGGTTALCAKRLGRTFITCDIDEDAVASASQRIASDG